MVETLGEQLFCAVGNDDGPKVKQILEDERRVNVNVKTGCYDQSPLYLACQLGYVKTTSMLLAHPNINVNIQNTGGYTPFSEACSTGGVRCVRLLLRDKRVDINKRGFDDTTPLYWTARDGNIEVIKWIIASGREVDLGQPRDKNNDAIMAAREELWIGITDWEIAKKIETAELLEKFRDHPDQTRHEVKIALGYYNRVAAEFFATVIFLCDDLMKIKDESATTTAGRFFNVARRLPMELQMILCYRLVGSNGDNIPASHRETAFEELAKKILSPDADEFSFFL